MFTETFFKTHHAYFSENRDVWMRAFLQLHVPNNYENDKQFKTETVEALRKSNVFKTTKLNPELVERNLLDSARLSVSSFCALAMLYGVSVAVVLGNLYIVTSGTPRHYVDASGRVRPVPASSFTDLYRVAHVGKPLNALSYYTAGELEALATTVRTPKGTKPLTYNGISSYIQSKLTALPA